MRLFGGFGPKRALARDVEVPHRAHDSRAHAAPTAKKIGINVANGNYFNYNNDLVWYSATHGARRLCNPRTLWSWDRAGKFPESVMNLNSETF
jgi:hypothetical protein